MKIEHVAFQVADPVKTAEWYVAHLGMTVKRFDPVPSSAYFLADSTGTVMLEIYRNPKADVPDYASMSPFLLHIAFYAPDIDAMHDALVAAGATALGTVTTTPSGDRLAMLRDPWGLAIQLVLRAKVMI